MQKRGIAPLIATVLIIGFTVALGAGVITWGSSYTKDALEETEVTASSSAACTQIILQIKEITCDASNQIQSLKLINNGIPLEGIIFQIRNNDETKKYQFLDPLSSLEAKTFTEIIPPLQNPTQIKVFAKLGEEVLCDTYIKKENPCKIINEETQNEQQITEQNQCTPTCPSDKICINNKCQESPCPPCTAFEICQGGLCVPRP